MIPAIVSHFPLSTCGEGWGEDFRPQKYRVEGKIP